MSEPVRSNCGRLAEVQSLLYDHFESGMQTNPEVVLQKAWTILNKDDLQWAMWEAGYFAAEVPASRMSARSRRAGRSRAA